MHSDSTHLMLMRIDDRERRHRAGDDARARRVAHLRRLDRRAERSARMRLRLSLG